MSDLNFRKLTVTTDGSGDGSATLESSEVGLLYSLRYVKTDYADGVDFTLASVQAADAATLLTVTNANASAMYYPRGDAVDTAGTATSTNTVLIPFQGKLKITVASGGATKTGTFFICWLE